MAKQFVYWSILAVLVGLISMPALAGTVDSGEFCVTDTEMHFDVEITSINVDTFDVFFGITAEGSVYVAPVEVLGVNFDPVTGAVTRAEKKVTTYEEPEFDRWVDGPVEDFTIESLGNRQWRLHGAVALGADKLLPGDKINMASMREFSPSVTAYGGPYTLISCEPTPPPDPPAVIEVKSYRGYHVVIDGELSSGEWPYQEFFDRQIDEDSVQAGWLNLSSGHVMFRLDQHRLYVAVDILDDNVDDPLHEGGMDAVWLLFDVDGDGQVSEGVDVRYRLDVNTGNLLRETFAAPSNGLSFNPALASTFSARASGFDCFTQDLSLFPTIPIQPPFSLSCNRHRVWEFAIDRGEIGAGAYNPDIHMAIAVQSGTPALIEQVPSDLGALGQYLKLELRDGYPFEFLGLFPAPQMAVSFTQGIESYTEDFQKIRGKRSALRVKPMDSSGGRGYKVALHGRYLGEDLPGSPLIDIARSAHFNDGAISGNNNTLVKIPDSWLLEGASYQVETYDHGKKSLPIVFSGLVDTIKPTYWLVPMILTDINGSSLPSASGIHHAREFTEQIFPLGGINWVARPPITSTATDRETMLPELNKAFQGVTLAWVYGLLLSGSSPFDMPDMIIAMINVRLCVEGKGAGCLVTGLAGHSSPTWRNQPGRIAWAIDSNVPTLAHELDHNLDRKAVGTWGRHAKFGCDASGPDQLWPYSDAKINAYGARIWSKSVTHYGLNSADLMSYCDNKWISPYRWNALLNDAFIAPIPTASLTSMETPPVVADVLYVSGSVGATSGGSLDPLVLQPGTVVEPMVSGSYTLRQLACDDSILDEASFEGFFEGIEGGSLKSMQFSYQLPKAGNTCALQLAHNDQLLAERRISANVPTVDITAPAGGTHWDGMSTISWTANDDDGDSMQYMVFYSPDGGLTWVYLAGPISDTQLQVDSSILEGSTTAQVRVVATDGFNTSVQDTADPFSVEASGPRTHILSHQDLQKVVFNQPLLLQGAGYRGQGSLVSGDAYRWFIDGEFAGIGEELTAALDLGEHDVELFVVGEDDLAGSDSVRLVVVPDEIFGNDFEQ